MGTMLSQEDIVVADAHIILKDFRRRGIAPDREVYVKQGQLLIWYVGTYTLAELKMGHQKYSSKHLFKRSTKAQDIADYFVSTRSGRPVISEPKLEIPLATKPANIFDEGYLTIKQAAEKEGVTQSAIMKRIQRGRVPGARRFGNAWAIPEWAVGKKN